MTTMREVPPLAGPERFAGASAVGGLMQRLPRPFTTIILQPCEHADGRSTACCFASIAGPARARRPRRPGCGKAKQRQFHPVSLDRGASGCDDGREARLSLTLRSCVYALSADDVAIVLIFMRPANIAEHLVEEAGHWIARPARRVALHRPLPASPGIVVYPRRAQSVTHIGRPEPCGMIADEGEHTDAHYPVLIGDIGGTNARFGLVTAKGACRRR